MGEGARDLVGEWGMGRNEGWGDLGRPGLQGGLDGTLGRVFAAPSGTPNLGPQPALTVSSGPVHHGHRESRPFWSL